MSTLTWITEKELEQVIKNKRDEFRWKKNENFIAAVSKWETLAASKVKMSGSEKNKSEQEHKQQKFWWTHTTILILHSRDKAVMLGINTIEFFLEEFTSARSGEVAIVLGDIYLQSVKASRSVISLIVILKRWTGVFFIGYHERAAVLFIVK